MTPNLLRESGEALYGEQWQSALARDLDVKPATLRDWLSGKSSIPDKVRHELRTLVEGRGTALRRLLEKLRDQNSLALDSEPA